MAFHFKVCEIELNTCSGERNGISLFNGITPAIRLGIRSILFESALDVRRSLHVMKEVMAGLVLVIFLDNQTNQLSSSSLSSLTLTILLYLPRARAFQLMIEN